MHATEQQRYWAAAIIAMSRRLHARIQRKIQQISASMTSLSDAKTGENMSAIREGAFDPSEWFSTILRAARHAQDCNAELTDLLNQFSALMERLNNATRQQREVPAGLRPSTPPTDNAGAQEGIPQRGKDAREGINQGIRMVHSTNPWMVQEE